MAYLLDHDLQLPSSPKAQVPPSSRAITTRGTQRALLFNALSGAAIGSPRHYHSRQSKPAGEDADERRFLASPRGSKG